MITGDPLAELAADNLAKDLRVGPTYLNRVAPGNPIPEHVDTKFETPWRWMVPLITNPKAYFTVRGKKYHLEMGSYYEYNITVPHGVINDGETDRIHLVFGVKR